MQKFVRDGRLVFYAQEADDAYWDEVWKKNVHDNFFDAYKRGELDYFNDFFPKHLSKNGKVLEAGCGLGQIVVGLNALGYDAEGVDFAQGTITFLQEKFPELRFWLGDLRNLVDTPNGDYQAYISLGVVEHLEDGPEPFLKEAHRILSDDGIILISVPTFNVLRRLKGRLGMYKGNPEGFVFYQYAYNREEFSKILAANGFEIIDWMGYSSYKGLKDEVRFIGWLNRMGGQVTRTLQRTRKSVV